MISVQNHRQLLSGNKLLIAVALLFVTIIAGCSPKFARPTGERTPPAETTKPEVEEKEDKPEEVKEEGELVTANTIALLLPFQLHQANQQAPSPEDIRRSALALDFYQGFKLGLDELAARGHDFRVNVLDTRDNVSENTRIAKLQEVQEAALVVGPVFPQEIKAFGQHAGLHNAVQISPLAASMPSEFNNPSLVTVTAPIVAHITALAQQVAQQYKAGDAVIMYNVPDESSRQFLNPLKSEIQKLKRGISISEVNEIEELENSVQVAGNNIVICGTTNKFQIAPLLAHLNRLKTDFSLDIQLYGHPNWDKIDFDSRDGLSNFNTRITSSYFIDHRSSAVRKFDQTYQQEFGIEPTEFAYKGYDAACYFGSLLAKYGMDYKAYITKETYDGLHNTFQFEYNPAWGYVNSHISILQYSNGSFRLIN